MSLVPFVRGVARPRPPTRAVLAAALIALTATAASAPDADAHASFLESSPAPGARLAAAPPQLELEFTEPLNERLTQLTLIEAGSGKRVQAVVRVFGGRKLSVRPRSRLEQAAYRIDWHSVSTVDGHVKEGSISFGVGTAALGGLELERSPLAGGRWVRIPPRAVLYAALFFFAGGALAATLVGRGRAGQRWLVPSAASEALAETGRDPDALARRVLRRNVIAGWIAAGGALAVVLVEAADAASSLAPARIADFLFSNDAGLARVGTVAFLVAAAAAARAAPRLAAGFAAAAFLSLAFSGHANSADPRFAAVATDWVHLLAGAIWVGGMAQIVATWLPALRGTDRSVRLAIARSVLPAFGRVALPAFLVVAATGLVNALIQLGGPSALWQTAYGRVLAVKIALVAAIGLASYAHAFRLRPRLLAANPHPPAAVERRHWLLLRSEPLLGIAVLAVAALLVAFPLPPGQAGESQPALAPCDPCPLAKPAAGELAVAEPAGRLTVAAWLRREDGRAVGTLRVLTDQRAPAAAAAVISSAERQERCGRGCWRFRLMPGAHQLRVRLRRGAERHDVRLPARWRTDDDRRARRLLAETQAAMRSLDTFRQTEVVTSAPGYSATAEFRFDAPDRMAYETENGGSVVIAKREWLKTPGLGWSVQPASDELPVAPSKRFRWTVFRPSARLIGVTREDGRRVAELAFFDYGYPVWYRMRIDLATRRVLSARLVTPANRIAHRYYAFNEPVRIEPPDATSGG